MARGTEKSDADSPTLADKRRQQIIAAAVTLFSERGYFQTTIEDISEAIGISKGLVYRYFKDKNDLLYNALVAVLQVYKQEKVVNLMATLGPLAALRRVLAVNCAMAEEFTQASNLAYHASKDLLPAERRRIMAMETEIAREIEHCLQACIDAGLIHPFDVHIMAYQYIMFGHTWALKHWALRRDYTMDEFLAEGERLLLLPHLTAAGRRKLKAQEKAVTAVPRAAAKRAPVRAKRKAA